MRKLLTLLILLPALALAQNVYNLFQPATGVLVGSTSTYVTTAAASTDIVSLWTGTCNATSFLRGDGSCQTVGTVTSITAGTGLTGGTITSSGTIALSTPVTTTNGGTGEAGTVTGIPMANGASAFTAATQANGTALFIPSADVNSLGIGTGSLTQGGITGVRNTGVGVNTLAALTSATDAVAIGRNSLIALTTGIRNTALGASALITLSTNCCNTAVGNSALSVATSANNTAIGNQAGNLITTGASNIVVGLNGNITTGGNNILIGNGLTGTAAGSSNQLDIADSIIATDYTKGPFKFTGGVVSAGTKFTASGCTNSATVGGATAGQFTSGTTGACTVTITMGGATGSTAPNGWSCAASDTTTPANLMSQSGTINTTTCTITGTTVSGDIITFHAVGY